MKFALNFLFLKEHDNFELQNSKFYRKLPSNPIVILKTKKKLFIF